VGIWFRPKGAAPGRNLYKCGSNPRGAGAPQPNTKVGWAHRHFLKKNPQVWWRGSLRTAKNTAPAAHITKDARISRDHCRRLPWDSISLKGANPPGPRGPRELRRRGSRGPKDAGRILVSFVGGGRGGLSGFSQPESRGGGLRPSGKAGKDQTKKQHIGSDVVRGFQRGLTPVLEKFPVGAPFSDHRMLCRGLGASRRRGMCGQCRLPLAGPPSRCYGAAESPGVPPSQTAESAAVARGAIFVFFSAGAPQENIAHPGTGPNAHGGGTCSAWRSGGGAVRAAASPNLVGLHARASWDRRSGGLGRSFVVSPNFHFGWGGGWEFP